MNTDRCGARSTSSTPAGSRSKSSRSRRAGAVGRRVASDGGAHPHDGHPAAPGPRPARRVPLPLRELGPDGLASAGAALTALAVELTREDGADGRWRFEGVEHITLRMYREGGASSLTPEDIRRRLEAALRVGAPAWNPYG